MLKKLAAFVREEGAGVLIPAFLFFWVGTAMSVAACLTLILLCGENVIVPSIILAAVGSLGALEANIAFLYFFDII